MDTKTKIIVKEIEYWRKSKLLPEHYCDFLQALYTEGSGEKVGLMGFKARSSLPVRIGLALVIGFTIIGLLVFYFSDFFLQMQISNPIFLLLAFAVSMLSGLIFRLFSVQCLGIFLLVLYLAWRTHPYFEANFSWFLFEAIWLMICFLFFFAAWAVKDWMPKLSLSFFVNAWILLFVPSVQAVYITNASLDIIQLIVMTKIVLALLAIFLTRASLVTYLRGVFG